MKYRIQDLIDIEQFQILQDRLNEIYSFPSSIIDNEGNILTATAWQDICTKFHRTNKECERDCIESDRYILSHLGEANPAVSYHCPRGLVDNAAPIIIDGIHYGNFFTGQFFLNAPDLNTFRRQAQRFGFDEEAYLESVKKVPIWTQDKLESYLFFIKGLITVISESGLKKLKEMEARRQIEESEERAATILDRMHDGFWIFSPEGGRIIDANQAMCRMLGYPRQELLNLSVTEFETVDTPERFGQRVQSIIRTGSSNFESRLRRKDGSTFDVEVSVTYLPKRDLFFGFHRDITERKQAEEQLQASLKEKEILLREIHHRVRNNLTIISSILSLQLPHIEDKKSQEIFRECENRVRTMSKIHTNLYRSRDLAHIDFGSYLKEVTDDLFLAYQIAPTAVDLVISIEDISLDINTALPLGLLLAELITNALKYAFPEGKKGRVKIALRSEKNDLILTVSDNGVGFPENVDFKKTRSLGLQLVMGLVKQLNGAIEMNRDQGTVFTITFPEP